MTCCYCTALKPVNLHEEKPGKMVSNLRVDLDDR